MRAPGMQPATRSMSRNKVHAASADAGSAKVFSSCTFMSAVLQAGHAGRGLALVDAQGVALLPDAERAVRHVHVGDAQVCEGVDHGVAEAGDAAHVRRFGNAL